MNLGTPCRRTGSHILGLALSLLLCGALAAAQPPSDPSSPATGGLPRSADIENVKPDVYYMEDASGGLVLVPDFSWEEFERLLLLDLRSQGPAPPPYVLERVHVRGTADQATAQLEIRIELQLTRAAETPVRVPLQLSPAILEDSQYEGAGEAILAYDQEAESYVCWLRGTQQSKHVVTLTMAVRLRQFGDDTRLELRLPEATTHVELAVAVPNAVVQPGTDQIVIQPTRSTPDGGSLITAGLAGGELRLDWRSGQRAVGPMQPLVSAKATVVLTVDDPKFLLADVRLDVTAERGTLGSFHVQLPPGMTLSPSDTAGYTLQVESSADAEMDAPQIVRVDLANTRERTASVKFTCHAARTSDRALQPFEAVGFTVREAFHQRTDLMVAVVGDWSIQVIDQQNVNRAGGLTEEDHARGIISKYVFYQSPSQTNSLLLAIQPQPSLIRVASTYVLDVREQVVRLDAIFRLNVSGAAARNLPLRFADWSLIDVQPAELVPARPEILGEGDVERVLVIPLEDSRLARDQPFEIRLSAERRIRSGDEKLGIDLPTPRAGLQAPDQSLLLAPATVVVNTAESIELQPLTAEMPDLYTGAPNSEPELPEDLQGILKRGEPLILQSPAASESLRFVARVRRRPQTITAHNKVLVEVTESEFRVRQAIAMDVQHQPLQIIPIELSAQQVKLLRSSSLLATVNDEALAIVPLPTSDSVFADSGNSSDSLGTGSSSATSPRSEDRTQYTVALAAPRTGAFEIVFTYRIARPPKGENANVVTTVPLVALGQQLAVTRGSTEITLQSDGSQQALLTGEDWARKQVTTPGDPSTVRIDRMPAEVAIRVTSSSDSRVATTVLQAWIQSVLMDDRRLDRAVFRVSAKEPVVFVQLPARANTDPASVSVAVDRQAAEFLVTDDGRVRIPLRLSDDSPDERVIEVWYVFQPRYPEPGAMVIDVARIEAHSQRARYRWQLVTPADEHLVWEPRQLVSETDWVWNGWFFDRRPQWTQRDFEAALGAIRAEPLPAHVNTYVFSTIGELPRVQPFTARRALVVLVASGIVLLIGISLIYVSWLRQPGVLLFLAVVILGVGYAQPSLGLIAAQSATAGLLLCLLAAVIDRLFTRRRYPGSTVRSTVIASDSGRVETPASGSGQSPAPPAPLSTTASAPYPVEMPSPELEP